MESVLEAIRNRRTIRKFTDQEVSDEQLETLLELGMCAPNRLNRQPWQFVVIRDQPLKKQLASLLRIHPYLESAAAVVAVCANPEVSPTWALDTSAAIENMLIGATGMGLGTAWVGAPDTAIWDMCEEFLHDALDVPANLRIPALVAVGYPDQELPAHGKHDRYDPTRVHYGKWGKHKSS